MFTTGAKYFFGVAFFSLVAAFIWGFITYGHGIGMATFTGIISLGFKGGVGQHLGYTLFVGLAVVSLFLGVVHSAVRDADPKAVAEVAAMAEVPTVGAPQGASVWPAVAGLGVAVVILGIVLAKGIVILGLILVAISVLELTVRAWSERATGDARINRQIRNRVMYPIELPLLALFGIVFFVATFSRILLSVDENTTSIIFAAVPFVIVVVAALVSARPHITRSLATGLLTLGALGMLALGVVGVARGTHHVEKEGHGGTHYVPDLPPGPLGNKPNIGVKPSGGNG